MTKLIKVVEEKGRGRLFCGHRQHMGDNYFILCKGNEMYTLCQACVGKQPHADLTIKAEATGQLTCKNSNPFFVKEDESVRSAM